MSIIPTTTRNNDLCFLINKINNIDVRHASNCEIFDMFLQISNNNSDDKHQAEHQPPIIVLEVQQQQKQQQQSNQTCLIFKHKQEEKENVEKEEDKKEEADVANKSVQTVVSLTSAKQKRRQQQQQQTNAYYNDDELDDVDDDDDDDDDEYDDNDIDIDVDEEIDERAPTTINDIINEDAHQLFEQCLAPEIDIQYEILFCIEDAEDAAVKIVENLRTKYPQIDTSIFLGGSNVGVNPKINNIHKAYEAAKYEFILISDSGIKMKSDTLLDMMQNMTDKCALVHQMPFTCDREGFAATFEKIFFGTVQSRIYLSADLLGINCHTGMSCLLRKSVIDDLGGLKTFGCYLAEDFFIAKAVTEQGWKMRISNQPAMQNSGICDISCFQARLIRWAKLRIAMVPTTILLEPLSECMIIGALAAWSASILLKWDPLVFYLVHILIWFLSDFLLLSFHKFEFVVGWLLRELSAPYLFLICIIGSSDTVANAHL